MEMEMRAKEVIQKAQFVTPPLPPLTSSLHDPFLFSHCSSCFLPLPPSTTTTTTTVFRHCSSCSTTTTTTTTTTSHNHHLLLLHNHPSSASLRAALHLLSLPSLSSSLNHHRLHHLLTNRHSLLFSDVRSGAKLISMAIAMRDGLHFDDSRDRHLEEAALCCVLTNAVEVSLDGDTPVGIAVYDWRFSWINHSCSPNSSYRFVSAFDEASIGSDSLRIAPYCTNGGDQVVENGGCGSDKLATVNENYGPRIVVRSIKAIQRGEEVTIAYTDLLRPTTLRRSELSLKYQFICNCTRCRSVPQTYVDHALQETFSNRLGDNSLRSSDNHHKDSVIEQLMDVFDSVITEYMEIGDSVSCCEKIESLLCLGVGNQRFEQPRGASCIDFRLSPLHHISLNAYTALNSTYKVHAGESVDGKRFHNFDMCRISAAYSLLLAGATNHLFLSESSLIASAATFWINAGESLLSLVRSSSWNSFANCMSQHLSSITKCPRCLLIDNFESNFSSAQNQNVDFDEISTEVFICISRIAPKVWSFLIQGCRYLEDVKDPVDFGWLGTVRTSAMWGFNARRHHQGLYSCNGGGVGGNSVSSYYNKPASETRTAVFQLGVHCLLYGRYLSWICYGHCPYRTSGIWKVLQS